MPGARVSRRSLLALAGAVVAGPARAAAEPFEAWLAGLRAEARAKGISAETVHTALGALRPNPRVLELDRRQPERTLTWAEYRARVVAEPRISQGRRAFADNQELLRAVQSRYGVPAPVICAIWGIEFELRRDARRLSRHPVPRHARL
ncbi:MAG: lytic murein transglycosylase [Acetobacteraceae bacterium]|nr:lytic murein transglycosylase [Acetobacteraceae bacterium]